MSSFQCIALNFLQTGYTGLHQAARWGHYDLASAFISWGADVNAAAEVSKLCCAQMKVHGCLKAIDHCCMVFVYISDRRDLRFFARKYHTNIYFMTAW